MTSARALEAAIQGSTARSAARCSISHGGAMCSCPAPGGMMGSRGVLMGPARHV